MSPSTLYAAACVLEGVPFINGSPQNTFVPGLIDMAVDRNVLIGEQRRAQAGQASRCSVWLAGWLGGRLTSTKQLLPVLPPSTPPLALLSLQQSRPPSVQAATISRAARPR